MIDKKGEEEFLNTLQKMAVDLFKWAAKNRKEEAAQLCEAALKLAHVWAARKAEAEASAIVAEMCSIDNALMNKLARIMDKLATKEREDGTLERLQTPVVRLSKGMLTNLDFALCWRIKRQFEGDVEKALARIRKNWFKPQLSLSALEVRNRLVALYKATNETQAKNALELALRDLGYPCPLDGKGHK